MKSLLNRIHARIGDLWWYSAMIFLACRSGDVIQAFIGLWLVPKYVGPQELGAVLPLQQLTTLFTVPLAIIATVFAKYVNTYATRGELGKVKCFIRDVLVASSLVFIVCIAAAYWLIPHFYSRLNVAAGTLTILILLSGFIGNISNLFNAALQGLKMFRTMTIQSFISAPIRLVTLLVAMPFRALSGYILGQTTPPASCSLLAALSLRKTLADTPIDHSWRKDLPEIWHYLWPVAIYTTLCTFLGSVQATIYRQRLPEVESAAYYMLSRFAEIATYVGASIAVVLAPMASEAHEKHSENPRILIRSISTTLLAALAVAALLIPAMPLLSSVNSWKAYGPMFHLTPVLTFSMGLGNAICLFYAYEISCRRFSRIMWMQGLNVFWTVLLASFTGYEFFRGTLPDAIVNWIGTLHVARLSTIIYVTTAWNFLQFLLVVLFIRKLKQAQTT